MSRSVMPTSSWVTSSGGRLSLISEISWWDRRTVVSNVPIWRWSPEHASTLQGHLLSNCQWNLRCPFYHLFILRIPGLHITQYYHCCILLLIICAQCHLSSFQVVNTVVISTMLLTLASNHARSLLLSHLTINYHAIVFRSFNLCVCNIWCVLWFRFA